MTVRLHRRHIAHVCTIPILALGVCISGCRERAPGSSDAGPMPVAGVVAAMASQVVSRAPEGRPIRLAVITLDPTQTDYAERNDFGAYLTEEVISELKKNPSRIRLFERSRLEVITRENALTLSGLINAETAAKIGELAPIDFILTGTYTRLAETVSVNTRMLDVVSGEIMFASSFEVALTADLRALFVAPTIADSPPGSSPGKPVDPCAKINVAITPLMADLSSPDKVSALVAEAVTVPFDTGCGRIHYKILGQFSRSRIADDTYTGFLVKTLDGIVQPTDDSRAREILRYFNKLGPLPEDLWPAVLETVCKVGNNYLNVYVGYAFQTRDLTDDQLAVQLTRLDEFVSRARKGAVGLPVPLKSSTVYSELVGGLGPFLDRTDKRLIYHVYDKHRDLAEDLPPSRHRKYLKSVYTRDTDDARRTQVLLWLCEYYNAEEPSERLGQDLYGFLRDRAREMEDSKASEEERTVARKHFDLFVKHCGPLLASSMAMTTSKNTRKDRALFCMQHGIDAPGLVPSVDSLIGLLSSDNMYDMRDGAEMLKAMGTNAEPAEALVQKLLRRAERLRGTGTTNLLWSLVGILGNIQTTDTASHRLLLHFLDSRQHAVPDSVQVALASIGAPVLPALKQALPGMETYMQIRVVEVFGLMGSRARTELPWLKGLLTQTTNAYLKDALEDAIDDIQRAG